MVTYDDFVIRIASSDSGEFLVAAESPVGSARVALPVVDFERAVATQGTILEAVKHAHGDALDRRVTSGRPEPTEGDTLRKIGNGLFQLIVRGAIRSLYYRSLGRIEADPARRIRIKINIVSRDSKLSALQNLPWEFLHQAETSTFLSLSRNFSIIRILDVARSARPLELSPPLRVLVVLSSPKDVLELDLRHEISNIQEAVGSHRNVSLEILRSPRLHRIREAALRRPFHVLHFVGHSSLHDKLGEGVLVFESENRSAETVAGSRFAESLRGIDSLRLIVIETCETARVGGDSRVRATADISTSLLLSGVPAVIFMQFPISERAAGSFFRVLYRLLGEGVPIDEAVAEGRMEIRMADHRTTAWGSPALFTRIPDGKIFITDNGVSRSAPNIHNTVYEAIASRSEVSVTGPGSITASPEGIAVDLQKEEQEVIIGYDDAFLQIRNSTNFVLQQLEVSYRQTREEAERWSRASLVAAGFGLSMLVTTVVSLIFGQTTTGAITAISSAVPGAISALFFKRATSANRRVDTILKNLTNTRDLHSAVEITDTITSQEERDRLKIQIVQKALQIPVQKEGT